MLFFIVLFVVLGYIFIIWIPAFDIKYEELKPLNKDLRTEEYKDFPHKVHLNVEWKIPCLNPNRFICGRAWQVWLRDERLVSLFEARVPHKKNRKSS